MTSTHGPYTANASSQNTELSHGVKLKEYYNSKADLWQAFLAKRKIMPQSWPIYDRNLQQHGHMSRQAPTATQIFKSVKALWVNYKVDF